MYTTRPMSGFTESRPILILGMHRSGTSAIARALNLLGVELGGDLLPPQHDNPTGFWEHAGVVQLHDQILAAVGSSWDDVRPLPDGWTQEPAIQRHRVALGNLIDAEFRGKPLWAVKDPRLSLLAPLWTEILTDRGCDPSFLLVIRDPREVAVSLRAREEMPASRAYLLWLRHTLAALRAANGRRQALIAYGDLLADWRTVVARVGDELGISFALAAAGGAVDAFLRDGLRHHVESGDPARDRAVPAWVRRAWSGLGARPADARRRLARLEAMLREADALFEPELLARETAIAELETERDDALQSSASADERARSLEVALADGRAGAEAVARDLAATRQALGERSREAEGLRSEHRESLIELGRRAAELESLATRRDEAQAALVSERETVLQLTRLQQDLQAELFRRDAELAATIARLRPVEEELASLRERSGRQEARIESLAADVARRVSDLERQQTERALLEGDIARARAAYERRSTELRQREQELADQVQTGSVTARELAAVRGELVAHRQTLDRLYGSRSWKLTKPLRQAKEFFAGGGPLAATQLDRARLRPGAELLPGRVVRQRFRPAVAELSSLGIYFFTYRRMNESRVRVQICEQRTLPLLPARRIHEQILTGAEIEDGRLATISLPRPLRRADRRRLVCEIESIDGRLGASVSLAFAPAWYAGSFLGEGVEGLENHLIALEFNPPRRRERNQSFAFISGCPGDAWRYRCEHQAEALRFAGYTADAFPPDVFPWDWLLSDYRVVVAHRVPHTPEFEKFTRRARDAGVEVVFDTDDLVFDPDGIEQIDAVALMSDAERDLFVDGVKRYRRSLALCDRVTVSTEALAREVEDAFPDKQVALCRNRVSEAMCEGAKRALAEERPRDRVVRLAYFSGTNTHRRDFAECVSALARILEAYPHVRLVLVGHIDLPRELAAYSARVDRHPFMDWRRLPALYREIDVNLAPLEGDNRFTEAKSELKYLEAALVGVPTVASRVGAFEVAIDEGRTGLLCGSSDEWFDVLRRLVENPDLREAVGRRARRDVLSRYSTRSAAAPLARVWCEQIGRAADHARKLRVAWVLRAPIASTGGGYKKIFQIANFLADRGHEVDVYVEPIAHLEGMSEAEIQAFCSEHFGTSAARIRVGHDAIRSSDVAIATNWPTAPVVDRLDNTTLKAYFVQDWEPSFYAERDPLHQLAEQTYDLPLRIISIGRYLAGRLGERNGIPYEHVDFALSDAFFAEREAVERRLAAPTHAGAPSLLFFARPEIPRRCFELGVAALERLHQRCPGVEIRLYGMEEERCLSFPYRNLGILEPEGVAAAMRDAEIHLSFSATNATTVMFEAMASGCATVELDQPGVRALLEDVSTCVLVKNLPEAVADALVGLVRDPETRSVVARRGYESVRELSVLRMCSQFEARLLDAVIGARGLPAD
jgi:glycosyltransferase involved in cell wall biosynthesis